MKFAALLFSLTVTTIPATPLIEQTKSGQALNFDLVIENRGTAEVTLDELEATVLGANDALVLQRRLAANGGSIATLPNRTIPAGGKLLVFNPFAEFESGVELARLRFDLTFGEERASVVVAPRAYETRTHLILPLRGRTFVHDGHDFYSHHRRLDLTGGMATALGIRENMLRYAYDFTIIDGQGRMYRDDGEENEEWLGWATPVLAPGDGVVVDAAADRPDGTKSRRAPLDPAAVMKDFTHLYGNYVVIDHGNGEFSVLAHMRQGSVIVKPGQRVKQGEKVGEVGMSGDARFPHLHYQLQRDAATGEGLPSYFSNYRRFNGKAFVPVRRGHIDTGDVVQSAR